MEGSAAKDGCLEANRGSLGLGTVVVQPKNDEK